MLLALAGCAGVVLFGFLLGLVAALANFNPYWGRGSTTYITFGSGFYGSLAGYALATIASLLLPATSRG